MLLFSDAGALIILAIVVILVAGAVTLAVLCLTKFRHSRDSCGCCRDAQGVRWCVVVICTLVGVLMLVGAFAVQRSADDTAKAIEDLRQQSFNVLSVNTADNTDLSEVRIPLRERLETADDRMTSHERLETSDDDISRTDGVAVVQGSKCTATFGLWLYGDGKYHLVPGSGSPLAFDDPACRGQDLDRLFGTTTLKR